MIDELNSYPKMKDSPPWGRVPEHWDAVPLRVIAKIKSITGKPDRELLSVYLDRGVIRFSEVEEKRTNVTSEDLSKYQAVDPGDFVLNNQQAWRGSVGVSRYTGIVSPAYLVLSLNPRIDPAYANLLFRDRTMVDQYLIASRGVGTIQRNLYWPSLKAVLSLLPPLPEQAAIVRFLNHMDHRILRYLRSKQKLIKLLEEEKQATINRVVTRGLDPNVRLKPSGVEWLGHVPEHWEVKRAKAVCSAIIDCRNRTPDHVENGPYIVVRTSCISNGEFDEAGGYRTDERNHLLWTARGAPRAGDVFFTREAPAGEAAIVPDRTDLCMGQRLMYFRPDPDILDSRFLLLNIYGPMTRRYIELATNGSTVGHLRLGQVYALPLLWCPLVEQRQIVAYVEKELGRIERIRLASDFQIALIREYRNRLIADAVTGKLDVRDVAAHLPGEAEELQLFDDSDAQIYPDKESTDALGETLEPIEA